MPSAGPGLDWLVVERVVRLRAGALDVYRRREFQFQYELLHGNTDCPPPPTTQHLSNQTPASLPEEIRLAGYSEECKSIR